MDWSAFFLMLGAFSTFGSVISVICWAQFESHEYIDWAWVMFGVSALCSSLGVGLH